MGHLSRATWHYNFPGILLPAERVASQHYFPIVGGILSRTTIALNIAVGAGALVPAQRTAKELTARLVSYLDSDSDTETDEPTGDETDESMDITYINRTVKFLPATVDRLTDKFNQVFKEFIRLG